MRGDRAVPGSHRRQLQRRRFIQRGGQVARGDRIELTLQVIGPGDFDSPEVSPSAVAKLVSFELAPLQNPGGPRHIAVIEALSTGTAELRAVRSSVGAASSDPFVLTIEVR